MYLPYCSALSLTTPSPFFKSIQTIQNSELGIKEMPQHAFFLSSLILSTLPLDPCMQLFDKTKNAKYTASVSVSQEVFKLFLIIVTLCPDKQIRSKRLCSPSSKRCFKKIQVLQLPFDIISFVSIPTKNTRGLLNKDLATSP